MGTMPIDHPQVTEENRACEQGEMKEGEGREEGERRYKIRGNGKVAFHAGTRFNRREQTTYEHGDNTTRANCRGQ